MLSMDSYQSTHHHQGKKNFPQTLAARYDLISLKLSQPFLL